MQDPNLPPGVTNADIDRAMGARPPHIERALERLEDDYSEAVAIMAALKRVRDETLEAAERLHTAECLAEAELSALANKVGKNSSLWPYLADMEAILRDRATSQEDPGVAYELAMDEFLPLDRLREMEAERAEEDRLAELDARDEHLNEMRRES